MYENKAQTSGSARGEVAPVTTKLHYRQPPVNWLRHLSDDRTLILAALVVALACWGLGERVTVGGGFGWDGVHYGQWARAFRQEILVKRVDSYHVQRILPSAIIHYSLRILHVSLKDAHLLRAFCIYGVFLLTLTAWAWCGIARELGISTAGKWLGFVGFFLNHITLKYAFFCPATTDTTAYALGVLMLYCHLTRKTKSLCVVTFLGAFAWPLCVYVGALLLLFPRPRTEGDVSESAPRRLHLVAAMLLTILALVGIKMALRVPANMSTTLVGDGFVEPIRAFLNLSIGLCMGYLFLGSFFLLNTRQLFHWSSLFTWGRLRNAFLALLLLAGIRLTQYGLANSEPFFPMHIFLRLTAYSAIAKPGIFLVTNVAFYGPMFLLLMFLWPAVCRHIHRQGPGLTLAVLLGLLLSVNSQSRFYLNIFVMILPFVIQATDDLVWGKRPYVLVAITSLALSKVWLTINCAPFTGDLLAFPDQYFYMAFGPWLSNLTYLVQGVVFLGVGGLLYAGCIHGKTSRQKEEIPHLAERAA